MAFPETGILDDFGRANENPIAGGWAGPLFAGEPQLQLVSSELRPNPTTGNSYWNAAFFGPDCEVYFTLTSAWAVSDRVVLYFRSTTNVVSGYRADFRNLAGDHLVFVGRMDSNVLTALGGSIDPADTFAAGDSFGVSMIGDTITVYRKPAAGAWTSLGTRTDSTYAGAGRIAVSITGTTVTVDDFGGGSIPGAPGVASSARSMMLLGAG